MVTFDSSLPFNYYDPFGLGRFATDHSHKGRFATFVRSCSAQHASKRQLKKITSEISMLEYPLVVGIKLILLFLKFVYFMKTSTINIHIKKFLMRNSESAYLFTFINIWKHVSRFILNFH